MELLGPQCLRRRPLAERHRTIRSTRPNGQASTRTKLARQIRARLRARTEELPRQLDREIHSNLRRRRFGG